MPYQSAAQRGYLHAQHPEIAAKWDAEIRRKKKVRKSKASTAGWLKPLAIGTAGGALANQLPSFEEQQRLRENRRRRQKAKKGVTKRLEAPTWPDDGFFNAKAAQEAYDLVMKMDPDAAEMFVTCVVSDALEADIEANRRTLQKHLDEVIAKQFTDLKRATMRVVAKGGDGEQDKIGFAQAITVLEEICKADEDEIPNWAFERKIRRDPGSGQFQTKIKRTQTKPINSKVANQLGIETHPAERAKKGGFTPEQKAQYQDEYRQLSDFLGSVAASTPNPGDTAVHLHFEDHHGNQWVEQATTTRPKANMLDPRDRNLKAIAAYPHGLNVGGAAFGLAGAFGGGMGGDRIGQMNAAAQGMPDFAQAWTADYGRANTNAALYGRTAAGGKLLAAVAPDGSKANLAGHFGQFVGQYGPQAEAVIGPPARRTAYRYRGTERKPDPQMVEEYRKEINRQMASRSGFGDEDTLKATKTAQTRALKAEEGRLAEEQGVPVESIRIPSDRRVEILNAAKTKIQGGARSPKPTWQEQNAASAAIMDYLQRPAGHELGGAAPKKGLYNLQLASGNTPPSEGVILDRDGQIVTQAIGYGDDHYLPFNLKNLKSLKGGSYIRNRSVGGLTSEDIYTGLVSGARRVTVVSRSGTFTMEFEPDFRGARRHNDKAARMTRRYEQLLDSVQSEQVENADIDPDMRRVITQSVRSEADQMGRGVMSSADIRSEVSRRIEDYKASPDIDAETEEYIDLLVNNRTAGMTSFDAKKIRAQTMNDVARDKEYKYRLNGNGYAAALEGLREQFPYYIKVNSAPTKEPERFETERDQGYVEPGKIRPTAAAVGLFGATNQGRYAGKGNKVSAAQANYAGRFTKPPEKAPEEPIKTESDAEGGEKKPETAPATAPATPATPAQAVQQAAFAPKAVAMQQSLKAHVTLAPDDPNNRWLQMPPEQFELALKDKDTVASLDAFVTLHGDILAATHKDMQPILAGYKQGAGRIGAKQFDPLLNQQWNPKPFAFAYNGMLPKAYQAGASEKDRYAEGKRIGAQQMGVVNLKPLDQMTDNELSQEVLAVGNIRRTVSGLDGNPDWETKKQIFSNVNSESPSLQRVFKDEDSMDSYLETVHRTRALNQGVPDAERGFKETFQPEATPEKNSEVPIRERVGRVTHQTEQALDHFDQGSDEHNLLSNLALDLRMQGEKIQTPKQFNAVMGSNKPAFDLVMRLIHEGKISNFAPASEPRQLGPGGGPILT